MDSSKGTQVMIIDFYQGTETITIDFIPFPISVRGESGNTTVGNQSDDPRIGGNDFILGQLDGETIDLALVMIADMKSSLKSLEKKVEAVDKRLKAYLCSAAQTNQPTMEESEEEKDSNEPVKALDGDAATYTQNLSWFSKESVKTSAANMFDEMLEPGKSKILNASVLMHEQLKEIGVLVGKETLESTELVDSPNLVDFKARKRKDIAFKKTTPAHHFNVILSGHPKFKGAEIGKSTAFRNMLVVLPGSGANSFTDENPRRRKLKKYQFDVPPLSKHEVNSIALSQVPQFIDTIWHLKARDMLISDKEGKILKPGKIKNVYGVRVKWFGQLKVSPTNDRFSVQLELIFSCLLHGRLEDADNDALCFKEQHDFEGGFVVNLVIGLLYCQCWCSYIPKELQLTELDAPGICMQSKFSIDDAIHMLTECPKEINAHKGGASFVLLCDSYTSVANGEGVEVNDSEQMIFIYIDAMMKRENSHSGSELQEVVVKSVEVFRISDFALSNYSGMTQDFGFLVLALMVRVATCQSTVFSLMFESHRFAVLELLYPVDGSSPSLEETYEALKTIEVLGIEKKHDIKTSSCVSVANTLRSSSLNLKDIFSVLSVNNILKCLVLLKDQTSKVDHHLGSAYGIFCAIKTLGQSDGRVDLAALNIEAALQCIRDKMDAADIMNIKANAGESGVPFFYISGSKFVEMLVDDGAIRVCDLYKKARKYAPCIVFVGEIDEVVRIIGGLGGRAAEEVLFCEPEVTSSDLQPNTGLTKEMVVTFCMFEIGPWFLMESAKCGDVIMRMIARPMS